MKKIAIITTFILALGCTVVNGFDSYNVTIEEVTATGALGIDENGFNWYLDGSNYRIGDTVEVTTYRDEVVQTTQK